MTNKEREFMGFLAGEGCFRVSKQNRKWKNGRLDYRPQISVAQRADNIEMLKWAKERFGGSLVRNDGRHDIPNQNPSYVWILTSGITCLEVLEFFLQMELPNNKIKQAKLLYEFCKLKIKYKNLTGKPKFGSNKRLYYNEKDYKYQEFVYKQLSFLKQYQVV